eukprot:12879993-Prorocentrum_lima.AAC.1
MHCATIGESIAPHQHAVGVPAAVETFVSKVQEGLQEFFRNAVCNAVRLLQRFRDNVARLASTRPLGNGTRGGSSP